MLLCWLVASYAQSHHQDLCSCFACPALRHFSPSNTSVLWKRDGIPTKKWFLGALFLGAPPISLLECLPCPACSPCPALPACLLARTHDHKVKGLALCRLS